MNAIRKPPPKMKGPFDDPAFKNCGPRRDASSDGSDQTRTDRCVELADAGDVLGLLDLLEDQPNANEIEGSTQLLSRCIRRKAKADLDALVDHGFARIIGFAILLLSRVQLYVAGRLAEAASCGGHAQSGVPCDLIDQGWLDRAQRISQFIAEMAAVRSRVQHLNELNRRQNGHHPQYANWLNGRSPMDSDPEEDGRGEGYPQNGRLRCQKGGIRFP